MVTSSRYNTTTVSSFTLSFLLTATYRFNSAQHQTVLLLNQEPLRSERVLKQGKFEYDEDEIEPKKLHLPTSCEHLSICPVSIYVVKFSFVCIFFSFVILFCCRLTNWKESISHQCFLFYNFMTRTTSNLCWKRERLNLLLNGRSRKLSWLTLLPNLALGPKIKCM